jgi:2-iminobutanoate/2-iminopropanoate deaminase
MSHTIHDTGVAKNIGRYSDAIEAAAGLRWLYTAGTPGMSKSGELAEGIEAQSRLAWANVLEALERAGMTAKDLVKVTTSLIRAEDIPVYARVRSEVLGDIRPAFMLQIVTGMVRPDILVEIEVVAAAR